MILFSKLLNYVDSKITGGINSCQSEVVFYLHNCQLLKGLDDREDIFPKIILSILEITKEKIKVLACTTDKFIDLPHFLRRDSILKIAS